MTNLGAPTSNQGALATTVGAPRLMVEQSGKNIIFFMNAAVAPGHHCYYLLLEDLKNLSVPCVFSSMYLCIYIAIRLHMVYVDRLQVVLESNLWYA